MDQPQDSRRQDSRRQSRASGLVLMGIVALWSGALAVGFLLATVGSSGQPVRAVLYGLLCLFLLLLSVRTGYELLRRLRA